MTKADQFEVNFFKPKSDHAKANKRLIITLAIIWAVATFGFQFVLIITSKPTPEKSYTAYESVWPEVSGNSEITLEAKQTFARSLLFVLGKNVAVKDNHRKILNEAFSWTVFSMQTDSVKNALTEAGKTVSAESAIAAIGLASDGFDKIMADFLPAYLVKVEKDELRPEIKAAVPDLMKLYLVHNQSSITDFSFIGFPFHYWYTAQFLLIMFVVLCLVYAVLIDRMNRKYEFIEED